MLNVVYSPIKVLFLTLSCLWFIWMTSVLFPCILLFFCLLGRKNFILKQWLQHFTILSAASNVGILNWFAANTSKLTIWCLTNCLKLYFWYTCWWSAAQAGRKIDWSSYWFKSFLEQPHFTHLQSSFLRVYFVDWSILYRDLSCSRFILSYSTSFILLLCCLVWYHLQSSEYITCISRKRALRFVINILLVLPIAPKTYFM